MYAKLEHVDMVHADAELETALEYYEKALELKGKEFGRYPEDLTCREDIVKTLGNIGDIFASQDKYEVTILFYRRIVEIEEQALVNDPFGWMDIKTLTNFLNQLGSFYGEIGDIELENKQYSKVVELYSGVLRDEKIYFPLRTKLAIEVQSIGVDFLKSRKYDAAKEAMDLALEFFESLYEENPEEPENYPYICEALYQSGKLQKTLGNFEAAAKNFDSLLPIMEKLLKKDPKSQDTSEASGVTYADAGEMYSLFSEDEKSKHAFENALAIIEALLKEEPDNPIYKIDQAEAFEKYSKLLLKLDRNKEAEDYISKSKEIYSELAEEDTGEEDTDDGGY